MRKEKALRAVNVRLTESDYAEYIRLGGVKWIRLYLRQSIEMRAMMEIEKREQREKTNIKRQINRAAKNSESGGTQSVVAVPKSVWQVVRKVTQTTAEESDSRL